MVPQSIFWVCLGHLTIISVMCFTLYQISMYLDHMDTFCKWLKVINSLTINIKYKFQKITHCLNLVCNKQIKWSDDNFSTQIRNLSKMYRKTFETIELFNTIFGLPILCSILTSSLIVLNGLTFISLFFYHIKLI